MGDDGVNTGVEGEGGERDDVRAGGGGKGVTARDEKEEALMAESAESEALTRGREARGGKTGEDSQTDVVKEGVNWRPPRNPVAPEES